ncbi:MAG TPA: restriction endonuclease [Moraxellaceae bacterium]|nr:restriction endonuclease [Moraxellaceae bacterium]
MANVNWTREQVLVALALYCYLPFGKLDQSTPIIIDVANRLGRTPGALAMKLNNLAGLDPEITSSGRVGLTGSSNTDKAIWAEFESDREATLLQSQKLLNELYDGKTPLDLSIPDEAPSEAEEPILALPEVTSSKAFVTIRRGQNLFRKMVLSSYKVRCCITGFSHPNLLVASHIRPWSMDQENRLNPKNGLCLNSFHDKAFDTGLIAIRPDLTIALSNEFIAGARTADVPEWFLSFEGKSIIKPTKFHPSKEFLDWHYNEIFKR